MSPQAEPPSETLISDADRERLAKALSEHHAAGRLTLEQHEQRVTAIYTAGSLEQAVRVLDGLPPLASRRGKGLLRRRGHGDAAAPGPGWLPTPERFRDPTSGEIMRVWVDPVSGTRHYVADAGD
ncbi:MAG: DUF1707 SHOCT-like domain-containing protein [Solirubrobacteraceae bacterium]